MQQLIWMLLHLTWRGSLVAVLSCEDSSTVIFLSSAAASMEMHTLMPPSDSNAAKLAEVQLMLPATTGSEQGDLSYR